MTITEDGKNQQGKPTLVQQCHEVTIDEACRLSTLSSPESPRQLLYLCHRDRKHRRHNVLGLYRIRLYSAKCLGIILADATHGLSSKRRWTHT